MADEEEPEISISEETLKLLHRRKVKSSGVGCFLCSMILDDYLKNGKLTGFPNDSMGKGTFPAMSKVAHVRLEKTTQDTDKIVVPPAGPYPPTIKVDEPKPKPKETRKSKSNANVPQPKPLFALDQPDTFQAIEEDGSLPGTGKAAREARIAAAKDKLAKRKDRK